MARDNGLELTPSHHNQLPPLAVTSLEEAAEFNEPGILRDEAQFFSESEGNGSVADIPLKEELRVVTRVHNIKRDNPPDEEVEIEEEKAADGLAGIINDSSLSGLSHQISTATSIPGTSILGRLGGYFLRTPQKPQQTSLDSPNRNIQNEKQQDLSQLVKDTVQRPFTTAKQIYLPIDVARNVTSPRNIPSASERLDIFEVPPSPPGSPIIEQNVKNDSRHKVSKPSKLVVRRRTRKDEADADGDAYAEKQGEQGQIQDEEAKHLRSFVAMEVSPALEQTTVPKRITRNTRAKENKSIGRTRRPGEPDHQALEGIPEVGQPSASQIGNSKPKRGRPRKNQNDETIPKSFRPASAITGNPLGSKNGNVKRSNRIPIKSKQMDNDVEEEVQVRATTELEQEMSMNTAGELNSDDADDILMNPSPFKAIHQNRPAKAMARKGTQPSSIGKGLRKGTDERPSQQQTERYQGPTLSHPKDPKNPGSPTQDYQSEEGEDEDDFITASDLDDGSVPPPRKELLVKSMKSFVDGTTVERMHSLMEEVGHSKSQKDKESKQKKIADNRPYATNLGRYMSKVAEKLAKSYVLLEELRSRDVVDVEKFDAQQHRASELIAKLNELTDTLLKGRLGNRSTGGRNGNDTDRKNVLEDLYIHVIPKTVEALCISARMHLKHSSLDTAYLEEFRALLKIIFELATAARAENKELQPKAPKSNPYRIVKPTSELLPLVRGLITKCDNELAARQLKDAEQVAAIHARKRRQALEEQERADEEDYLRRLKERNRAIIISLNKSRARLGLPPSSQLKNTRVSSQSHWDRKNGEESFDEEPFDDVSLEEEPSDEDASEENDDADHERLSLFDRNNSHPERIPREWTKEEMEILVDGLWRNQGPTRYEKLAKRLDRSMDEIFGRARYFKEQVQATINRKQEERPDMEHAKIESWVENIGHEF